MGDDITEASLREAIAKLEAGWPPPCDPHVVSPEAKARGGWQVCANCFDAVFVAQEKGSAT